MDLTRINQLKEQHRLAINAGNNDRAIQLARNIKHAYAELENTPKPKLEESTELPTAEEFVELEEKTMSQRNAQKTRIKQRAQRLKARSQSEVNKANARVRESGEKKSAAKEKKKVLDNKHFSAAVAVGKPGDDEYGKPINDVLKAKRARAETDANSADFSARVRTAVNNLDKKDRDKEIRAHSGRIGTLNSRMRRAGMKYQLSYEQATYSEEPITEGSFMSGKKKTIPKYNYPMGKNEGNELKPEYAEKLADGAHRHLLAHADKNGHAKDSHLLDYLEDKADIVPGSVEKNLQIGHVEHILKHKYGWTASSKPNPATSLMHTIRDRTLKNKVATGKAKAQMRSTPSLSVESAEEDTIEEAKSNDVMMHLRRARRAAVRGDKDTAADHREAALKAAGGDAELVKKTEAELAKKRIMVSLSKAEKGPVVEESVQLDERSRISTLFKAIRGKYSEQAKNVADELERRRAAAKNTELIHRKMKVQYAPLGSHSDKIITDRANANKEAAKRLQARKETFAAKIAQRTKSKKLIDAAAAKPKTPIKRAGIVGVGDSKITGGLDYGMRRAKGYGNRPGDN